MAKKVTGLVEILVNGNLILNKANATASGIGLSGIDAFERKSVMGDGGIHGFVDEPQEARCEVTITDREDQMLNDLADINGDGTVIFRSKAGGKVYTMDDATCAGNFTLTAGEGEVSIVFIGSAWQEAVQ